MQSYVVSVILSIILVCLFYIIFHQAKLITTLPVKIIIDAENIEGKAEHAAISANLAVDRYFENAEIIFLNVPEEERELLSCTYNIKSL